MCFISTLHEQIDGEHKSESRDYGPWKIRTRRHQRFLDSGEWLNHGLHERGHLL